MNRKKTNGGSEAQQPKKSVVFLRATMSLKKENNVHLVDEKCEDLAEDCHQ